MAEIYPGYVDGGNLQKWNVKIKQEALQGHGHMKGIR
jgi:hypothetical protein